MILNPQNIIAEFGTGDCYASIIAAVYKNRVYAIAKIFTPSLGMSRPVTTDALDFESEKEAIGFFSKIGIKMLLKAYDKKYTTIILDAILQPPLF